VAFNYLKRKPPEEEIQDRWIEPHLGPDLSGAKSAVFDSGKKTIIDCAHVRVERLGTYPVLFSKVFKEFEDRTGHKYDYRYWAERENFFLREFLKRQNEFTHVVQARHLISENEAAKQVLTRDAGITIADWLRVKPRYADTATLSHPFQRSDAFLRMMRACLVALKQIHEHRIVHCDIKEDNICIPYAPHPFPGGGRPIHLEYENLKLIDFAFAVAHSIPLTQILVINPDERVPYQSELLVSALRADRRSGCPNAVQQLDYRVDLFSLGFMAEKISAAGLDCPSGSREAQVREDIRKLVQTLKAFDSTAPVGPLPHDGLLAEIDRLLVDTAGSSSPLPFQVDGEWTPEEMAQSRGASRPTPLTPVASPLATPVSAPLAQPARPAKGASRLKVTLVLAMLCACAGAAVFLLPDEGDSALAPPAPATVVEEKEAPAVQPAPPPAAEDSARILALLRSDDEAVFQATFGNLSKIPANGAAIAEAIAAEYAAALASSSPIETRARALGRLIWMAKAGNELAARRVAAFEKTYDTEKANVAKSPWWVRGEGAAPAEAISWVESGALLAGHGDRPAMLDLAFAMGHGRGIRQDRARSVETYLKVMASSTGGDEFSTRIRQSAARGLTVVLNRIVEQKDRDAAVRLIPALQSNADAGAAGMQYYLGLFNECVARPANLDAARQWYRKAASDPEWKDTVERKARLLGKWCPHPARA
jgi:serine/threonine protein kinase/TPR repeat protein